ncbi:MAG: hypothetical protein ACYSW0_11325 [Planctomycetota bacterium]
MEMTTGLLWQDHGSADFEEKIGRAALGFEKKFGFRPTLCYTSNSVIEEGKEVDGIRILELKRIQKNHFWLGVPDERSGNRIGKHSLRATEGVSGSDSGKGDRCHPESSERRNGPITQRRIGWAERSRDSDIWPIERYSALDAGPGTLPGKTV